MDRLWKIDRTSWCFFLCNGFLLPFVYWLDGSANNETDSAFTITLLARFYIIIACNYGGSVVPSALRCISGHVASASFTAADLVY